MALISPGLQLTVTDESQYVPGAVGSVPLVILATAQDKTVNGAYAAGTAKTNAGKLQAFTSQRELVSALGYPTFQQSSAGTPLHGDELNEYGLMAAYSTLALGNRVFAIRADINLNELTATSVRPIGAPDHGTFWLDIANTTWGINEWNAATSTFTTKTPLLITSLDDTTLIGSVYTPKSSVGTIGSYAVVVANYDNRMFYKAADNAWYQVGTDDWKNSWATVVSTASAGTITVDPNAELTINDVDVTVTSGTALSDVVSAINAANIDGVTAVASGGLLVLFADSNASSTGGSADGKITIADGLTVPCLADLRIAAGTYFSPQIEFGDYVNIPSWRSTDTVKAPTGSVYIKTSVLGNGMNLSVKEYNADADTWSRLAVPVYATEEAALYGLDPASGGFGIGADTTFAKYELFNNTLAGVRLFYRATAGATRVTGSVPSGLFTSGNKFTLRATTIGEDTLASYTITLSGTTTADFIAAVAAANIPYVSAEITAAGAITFVHSEGGNIELAAIAGQGTPLTTAGFNTSNMRVKADGSLVLSNFSTLVYTVSLYEPYQAPVDGTHWYYGSATTVDIMINDNGWKGYHNVPSDARGYDLSMTDPAGVIVSASKPTTQSDNTALEAGDLWLDTSDLVNYPKLYRYNAANAWVAIDNTDRVSQNGIIFADARWDMDGTADIIAGALPSTVELLASNYLDLDAPDYRLYPRGTLLFNTRRSGFNVKQFVGDYFNDNSFPNQSLPDVTAAWVSVSGLKDDGSPYMGTSAQRNMVVKALRAAIDGNTEIREDQYAFNLIAAPGYPEAIANMVALNNDRANTAFVIGDTPMTLPTNTVDIANWSNNTNGDGLTTADPYLGVFYPAGLTNDLQGNVVAVPSSHMALRTFVRSDNVSYPWFAPAGVRRGLIDNASDIGYVNASTGGFIRTGVNQGLRDSLYENRINPLTVLPGIGLCSWGQKTRNGSASAMDRINVARLVNYIRTILATVGNGFLFEPNDKTTRDQLKTIIEGSMNDLVAKRGIYDYVVVCDTTNNTPERIARNELYVDIAIEPVKDVEFIYIPIRLKNPGDIARLGS
jgi:hypothetical protein